MCGFLNEFLLNAECNIPISYLSGFSGWVSLGGGARAMDGVGLLGPQKYEHVGHE